MAHSPDTYFMSIISGEVYTYAEWLDVDKRIPSFNLNKQIEKGYLRRVVWNFNRWIYY